MTDAALRRLERAWRAAPSDATLEPLLAGCRRVGREAPVDALRRSQRWRRLDGFVRKWYAAPLRDEDGESAAAIAQAEARLGLALPVALREWYRLVGRRLEPCGDRMFRLDELAEYGLFAERALAVCVENQGVVTWGCRADELDQEDPPGYMEYADDWRLLHGTLSELLFVLVVRLSLMGASIPQFEPPQRGALGALGPEVRGGHGDGAVLAAAAQREYPALPFPPWPWPCQPTTLTLHGDADTVVEIAWEPGYERVSGAARTPEAWRRLDGLLGSHGNR